MGAYMALKGMEYQAKKMLYVTHRLWDNKSYSKFTLNKWWYDENILICAKYSYGFSQQQKHCPPMILKEGGDSAASNTEKSVILDLDTNLAYKKSRK